MIKVCRVGAQYVEIAYLMVKKVIHDTLLTSHMHTIEGALKLDIVNLVF
jgi:hypothetical protein